MRRNRLILTALILTFLTISNALAASFRAEITNDSKVGANKFFTVNLYCTNNDSIRDAVGALIINRVTWTSPVTFTGTVSLQWQDTLTSSHLYQDDATLLKFTTSQFNGFWDLFKGLYVESWDNNLPDRFSYAGIGNTNGYPPALGEIKVLSWHAQTASTSGSLCVEQGDMTNDTYDWLFDDPTPSLIKTCWTIKSDTFSLITTPSFNSICCTLKTDINSDSILCQAPDTIMMHESEEMTLIIRAMDLGGVQDLAISTGTLPQNSNFVDQGNGVGQFTFHPSYDQGSLLGIYYKINFSVTDGESTSQDSVYIKVFNSDRIPVLTYVLSPRNVSVGHTERFTVYGSDPDTENIVIQVDYLTTAGAEMNPHPAHATFTYNINTSSGVFEFTPDSSQADNRFIAVFQAFDPQEYGSYPMNVEIRVNPATGIDDIDQTQLPSSFQLSQNYPNPFNLNTVIEFALPSASRVELDIYNILGQKVKTLVDQELPAGFKTVTWDGHNDQGNIVASGVYFYRMTTRDFQSSKKLLLLK